MTTLLNFTVPSLNYGVKYISTYLQVLNFQMFPDLDLCIIYINQHVEAILLNSYMLKDFY